ncbi:hypothetical protein KBD18_00530 [Patescibacteria group bacterium]|nr:hypothetical protein [Patescibacteria group bacterium]
MDFSIEDELKCELARLYPGCSFIGEERGLSVAEGAFRCIIDPLDRTANYVAGLPHWCVMVACMDVATERLLWSIIYAPRLGEFALAIAGKGAWLNGKRIRVTGEILLTNVVQNVGVSHDEATLVKIVAMDKQLNEVRNLGSCGCQGVATACGRIGFFPELGGGKVWDVAPVMLMVQEAGGVVVGLDYGPVQLHLDEKTKHYFIFTTPALLAQLKFHGISFA